MANQTVSADSLWAHSSGGGNHDMSSLAYNETVTVQDGATLTIDQSAIGLSSLAVGANLTCVAGFSTVRLSNNSTSQALQYAGPESGALRVESGSRFEVRGGFCILQDSGVDWESDGTADQIIPGASWTALYAAANEPAVIFVETGDGTNEWEPWLNIGDGSLDNVGAAQLGKWFSYNTSTGAITFGDGGATTAGRGGAIPPTGARVRVYNIGIGKVDSGGTWGIHATPGTNFETDIDAGGILDLQNCYAFGFFLATSQAREVIFDHVASVHKYDCRFVRRLEWSFVFACVNRYVTSDYALYMRSIASALIEDSMFAQDDHADTALFEYCKDGRAYRTSFILSNRNSANDNTIRIYRSPGFRTYDCKFIGGRWWANESPNVWFVDPQHSDSPRGVAFGSLYGVSFNWDASSSGGGVLDGLTLHPEGQVAANGSAVLISACEKIVNCDYPGGNGYTYNGIFGLFAHNNQLGSPTDRVSVHNAGDTDFTLQNTHFSAIPAFFENSIVPSSSIFKGVDNSSIPTNLPGCANTHFYEWRTALPPSEAGQMGLFFTPKNASSQAYEIVAGTVSYDLNGRMYMLTSDAEIIYTWPHWVKGVTAFPSGGTLTKGGVNPNDFTIQYDIDLGSGFSGSWTTLSMANLAGHTIDPTVGFRLKIRITRGTAGATDYLNQLTWDTTTDYATYQYPAALVSVTLRNLKDGARYWLKNEDSGEVLATGLQSGDGDVTLSDVPYNGVDEDLTLKVRDYRTPNFYLPLTMQGVLTENGADFYVSQTVDALAS